jgi:hypothetical protein
VEEIWNGYQKTKHPFHTKEGQRLRNTMTSFMHNGSYLSGQILCSLHSVERINEQTWNVHTLSHSTILEEQ